MAEHRPTDLTGHAAPPFPLHSPDPEHKSRLSRRFSISRVENAIREIFFGNARVKRHAINEYVHAIQQQDEDFYDRLVTLKDSSDPQQAPTESQQRSPSIEARECDTANQNGFGDDKERGWSGPESMPSVRGQSKGRLRTGVLQACIEKRVEAAVDEAIDEGADELYRWPGPGPWASPRRP